ncbi:hypothetical protein MKX03_006660 [Papaver bracteatum]|nr:hypothetical protein MKX03_006660 [Papaver bracteatum]
MGKRKIEIKKILDTTKRIINFSKRREGIKNKAAELCRLFADIIVCRIVLSPAGKAFTFSNALCNIVELSKTSTQCRNKAGAGNESTDTFWWDNIDTEELDSVEKLKSFRESLANLKQRLSASKEKLTAAASSPLSSSSSTIEDTVIEERIVEDTATTITEKHEAGKSCSKDHPNLDLSLNLGWKFDEKAATSLLRGAEIGGDEDEEWS